MVGVVREVVTRVGARAVDLLSDALVAEVDNLPAMSDDDVAACLDTIRSVLSSSISPSAFQPAGAVKSDRTWNIGRRQTKNRDLLPPSSSQLLITLPAELTTDFTLENSRTAGKKESSGERQARRLPIDIVVAAVKDKLAIFKDDDNDDDNVRRRGTTFAPRPTSLFLSSIIGTTLLCLDSVFFRLSDLVFGFLFCSGRDRSFAGDDAERTREGGRSEGTSSNGCRADAHDGGRHVGR